MCYEDRRLPTRGGQLLWDDGQFGEMPQDVEVKLDQSHTLIEVTVRLTCVHSCVNWLVVHV